MRINRTKALNALNSETLRELDFDNEKKDMTAFIEKREDKMNFM